MQKVINILVSIVFLISFIGVNIHKHYSHGELYSTAIFQEAESCCSDMEHCEMTSTSATSNNQQQNDCSCEDKTEIFKISDDFVSERFSIPTEKIIDLNFVSLFQAEEINFFIANYHTTYIYPSPPLCKTDAQSEFGVFLI